MYHAVQKVSKVLLKIWILLADFHYFFHPESFLFQGKNRKIYHISFPKYYFFCIKKARFHRKNGHFPLFVHQKVYKEIWRKKEHFRNFIEVKTKKYKNMRNTFILFVISVFFFSCVEEYKVPKEMTQTYESKLVIQGQILSGDNSVIYLNNTVPFGQVERPEPILNAEVTVIGQNGYESEKAKFDIENDRYVIPTLDLPNNTQYAIKVVLDGETYQSEYQSLLSAKTIDDFHFQESPDGVSFYVSSHGEEEDSPYYMWTYEEDWEFHADIDMSTPTTLTWSYREDFYPGIVTGKSNPYYYCWNHNESSLIHIYDAGTLSQNITKKYKLLNITKDDIRISYIYSILVKQASLSTEAYEYFRLHKLYTEQSGGLFTPMPGEIISNIKCISNPEREVYGYVVVSNITTRRMFIYASDLTQVESEYSNCHPGYGDSQKDPEKNGTWKSLWYAEMEDPDLRSVILNKEKVYRWNYNEVLNDASILYPKECVDCRTVHGATKKRPDFWPNDHE